MNRLRASWRWLLMEFSPRGAEGDCWSDGGCGFGCKGVAQITGEPQTLVGSLGLHQPCEFVADPPPFAGCEPVEEIAERAAFGPIQQLLGAVMVFDERA